MYTLFNLKGVWKCRGHPYGEVRYLLQFSQQLSLIQICSNEYKETCLKYDSLKL